MFLQFTVGLTDVYVAGRFRPEVQGAVGFSSQLLFLFNVLANGLGVGLVAVISRHQGARDFPAMWHASRQGLLLTGLVTAPLSLAGMVIIPSPAVLSFLPVPVAAVATDLLPYYAASLLPQAVLTVSVAIFRARAVMGLVLVCSGATAFCNLLGDFALAFGWAGLPALGPTGIALATTLSALVGALLAGAILLRQGLGLANWQIDVPLTRRLWQLSWPVGLLQLGWNLGGLALYAILGQLPRDAVAATAALTNGLRIEAILYLPAFALNMIAAVLIGQALGAGDPLGAERLGWRIAKAAALVLTLLAVPVFIFSLPLAGMITPDPAVQRLTSHYLRFNMVSQPFMALSVCLGGALEGAGDTFGAMKVVLGTLWAIRIPLAALLALATPLGATGVWTAMVASMLLQGAIMAHRFQRGNWQRLGM